MGKRIETKLEFEESTKTTGKYLVFDIETTGLPINRHAPPEDFKNWPYPVQIAWLLFDDEHKLIEHNNFYLKQSVEIPADATSIHGITTAMMLEKGIEPSNVYDNFKKAIDKTEYIISHNTDFDIPILHCDFLRNRMQWTLSNNRIFCTMKTGASFCKIGRRRPDGEYKWPTLTELYQKCFYPEYSMKILSDMTLDSNLHNANIDAALVAQCFFKLKELGFLKEFEYKTTANRISAEQIEDNFDDLHVIEYIDSFSDEPFKVRIQHLGLGTSRLLKDEFKWRLENTVKAELKKFDERWVKISRKKKSQADKEASLKIAEERTRDAQEKQKKIEDLLIYVLNIDNAVNWNSLKDTKEFEVPNPNNNLESELSRITQSPQPRTFKELPKEPDKGLYQPQLSLVDKILKSLREKKIRQAETLYQKAMTAWRKSVDETNLFNANLKEQYEQKLNEYEEQKQTVNQRFDALEQDWEREREAYNNSQKKHNETTEKLKENYFNKNAEAVKQYCEMVLNNSRYPETFPKDFDLDYNSDSKLLIVEYVLPAPDDLPTLTAVKYIAAKNKLKESFLSETQLSKIYDSAIYKITLRTLHELFEADKAEALEIIILNGWVNTIDKATGKKVSNCIVTIQANKIEFNEIELSNVDANICFKNLNGIGSSKLISITAVQPIAQITSRL